MTICKQIEQYNELTHFSEKEVQLIKNYLCKEIDDVELKFFSDVCRKTGLDPFTKQVYAIKRKGQLTIQTSIDGYRLVAERTGRYCPGKEPNFTYDQNGKLVSATAYVKKQTADSTWHEVAATAFYNEYKPNYPSNFWDTKAHIMLSKCAEALALRKAFPNDLSQLYTKEEMDQADNIDQIKKIDYVTHEQGIELQNILDRCSSETKEIFYEWMNQRKIISLHSLPKNEFSKIHERLSKKSREYESQAASLSDIEEITNVH